MLEINGMTRPAFNHYLVFALGMCLFCSVHAQEPRKPTSYDFRESDQYRALDDMSRLRLEAAVNDLGRLERALDAFMKDHEGAPPIKLEELVPDYIEGLPQDPFWTVEDNIPAYLKRHQRSLDGRGYLYLQKPTGFSIKSYSPLMLEPTPGAWQIQSVGLRDFPLRYPRSNPGLIRTRGYWGRMKLDIF